MKTSKVHQKILTINEALEALYSGIDFSKDCPWTIEDHREIRNFYKASDALDDIDRNYWLEKENTTKVPYSSHISTIHGFHHLKKMRWIIPEKYLTMDVDSFILDKCQRPDEIKRVKYELKLFYQQSIRIMMLRILIYLIDEFRKYDIVWGVGRGSSVSSYCLYLLGVHKIDSIKYNLNIEEFLREFE